MLIFPILREVWKPYCDDLALLSHETLTYDDDLTGVPDHFVRKISEYGQTIPDIPVLLIAEAKLDDFGKAWGHCAATMLAAQKLNQTPDVPVYGIATNGGSWQFGVLLGRELTVDPNGSALMNLDTLAQRLHAVLRAVLVQAKAYTVPVAA